jgi:hypothetical protein
MTHKEIVESVRFAGNAYGLQAYKHKLAYYGVKATTPKRLPNDRERAAKNRKSAAQIRRELGK